jgi:hypothetical protein
LRPSDISLSPTASYRAVGDKKAVGCVSVYCSARVFLTREPIRINVSNIYTPIS